MPSRFERIHVFWRAYRWELFLSFALFAVALAVRLPNLQLVPRYSDEGDEVLWALGIARGQRLPLTGADAYYGPLFYYLLAALFRSFGVGIFLPRELAAVFGALTVVATYWLGRLLWTRGAGVVAACFAVTSPGLVVVGSHYGWSSSLTPFFSTATLASLYGGIERRNTWALGLSGLLASLTLQTHPITIVALAAMLLWFLLRRDLGTWLKRRAAYASLSLFGLGYAPMLVANVRLDSPMLAAATQRRHSFGVTLSPDVYLARLSKELSQVLILVGGGVERADTFILQISLLLMAGLALAGFIIMWHRGKGLLATVFIVTLLLLPIFVKTFAMHYITFLAPIAFVPVGCLFAVLVRHGRANSPPWAGLKRIGCRVGCALAGAVGVALLVFPLVNISEYYHDMSARGSNNQDFFLLRDMLRASSACGNGLFLDDIRESLREQSKRGWWVTLNSIDYVLTLDNCDHADANEVDLLQRLAQRQQTSWIILPAHDVATFSQRFQLELVPIESSVGHSSLTPFALYRVKPRRS